MAFIVQMAALFVYYSLIATNLSEQYWCSNLDFNVVVLMSKYLDRGLGYIELERVTSLM